MLICIGFCFGFGVGTEPSMDADAWMHSVVGWDLPSDFMVLSKLPFKRGNVYCSDLSLSSLSLELITDHKSQKMPM